MTHTKAPETWWRVNRKSGSWQPPVEPVTIQSATEKMVTVKDRREAKLSDWTAYFPTLAEAAALAKQDAERAIESAKRRLAEAEAKMVRVEKCVEDAKETEARQ